MSKHSLYLHTEVFTYWGTEINKFTKATTENESRIEIIVAATNDTKKKYKVLSIGTS